ncbi:MAG: CAP domain-containing protein [Peptostreptococcaceae bacterium]|nr:CAP domain-containing protein [Peptostreptococcaceae bacterium]
MKLSQKRYLAAAFLLFLAVIFSPRAFSQTQWKIWDWKGPVAEDKVWRISFSHEIDASSVNRDTVYVEDAYSNRVSTRAIISLDGRSIELSVSNGKYAAGEKYTLFVRDIRKKSGGRLREPVRMDFRIRSPHSIPEEEYAKKKAMLELINQERRKAGVGELALREEVVAYADLRAREIVQKFDHTRPDGSKFHSGMPVPYSWVGENIAAGRDTAAGTMDQLMNSSGHRRNILRPEYTQVAIGYRYEPGSYYEHYWVQLFLKP